MKKYILLFITAFTALTSCSDWLDVNKNPGSPSDISATMAFTAGTGYSATVVGGQYALIGGIFAQHFTQNNTAQQYRDWEAYKLTPTDMNSEYLKMHGRALANYRLAEKKAEADGDWNIYLMATVMDAYSYQVLADVYDEVPYFEALKAGEDIIKAKFDKGSDIYADLFKRLDEALAKDFSAKTNTNPGSADLIFNGDIDSWKAFANTLKLKLALRQYNAKPDESRTLIAKMLDANTIFLKADAAVTAYEDKAGSYNPLYDTEKGLNFANLRASNTTLDFLKDKGDARLQFMYIKGKDDKNETLSDYIGLPQGSYNASSTTYPNNSLASTNMLAKDPVVFISGAESYFLQAEALLRVKNGVGAEQKYIDGVELAYTKYYDDRYNANGDQKAALKENMNEALDAGGVYAYNGSTLESGLKCIITQKWLSMFLSQGLEAWLEHNRTGYPDHFTVPTNSNLKAQGSNIIIQRFAFPEYEYTANTANTPALVSLAKAIWWGKLTNVK